MTTTLEQVVAAVQDIALSITGIRVAPDSLPDAIQTGPSVLTYPESGMFQSKSLGLSQELHTITSDLIISGGSYAQAYKFGLSLMVPFCRAIIASPTLAGMVQTYESVTYTFDRNTLVWTVKINNAKILEQ